MIPLHHSNRPNGMANTLPRKSARSSANSKSSLSYNGSSNNYINAPPLYTKRPPPMHPGFQQPQPTILSLQQPFPTQNDGPFLIAPPTTPTSNYGARRRSGWPVMTPQQLSFDEDMSVVSHCQERAPSIMEFQPNSKLSFYCERKNAPRSKNRFYWKGILFFAILISWGLAAYKYQFFGLNHSVDTAHAGIRDAYESFIESEWVNNLTVDRLSQGITFMKEQMESIMRTRVSPEFLSNSGTLEGTVILSINEDAESTVEVIEG